MSLICCRCKKDKFEKDFYRFTTRKRGYSHSCKECDKKKYLQNKDRIALERRKYYQENHQEILKRKKDYYRKGIPKIKEKSWKQKNILINNRIFNIEDYNREISRCNKKCEICNQDPSNHKKGFCVDHNHNTYHYRGILCSLCNSALGYFKEDIVIMTRAIEYLRKTKK